MEIFSVVALIVLTFLVLLCFSILIVKRNFIWCIIKNCRRDFRGAISFCRVEWFLRHANRINLTVHQRFDQITKKYPDSVCCYFENESWTFLRIQEFANRVANYFLLQNFERGASIGLYMENRPEYVGIWLGLAKIGIVPALLNTNLRLKPLEHSLNIANCKAIIFGSELKDGIDELLENGLEGNYMLYQFGTNENQLLIPNATNLTTALNSVSAVDVKVEPEIGFHDKLFYIYTSGTTGLPKAATIKHSRYLMISAGGHFVHGVTTDDTIYAPLPLYHGAATIVAFGHALMFGSTVVFRKKFSATNYWQDCIRYNVTILQYIGEVCRYVLSQPPKPEDTQHKVRLMYGNGLRAEIWTDFVKRFNIPHVREFYGSTEGNCSLASVDNTVGAVGFVPTWAFALGIRPVLLVKVHDDTGEILRDPQTGLALRAGIGEPGEMVGIIKPGDPIREFQGYTDEASQMKKEVRDICKKGDIGFRSGDILMMDSNGYFYFKDRQGDTFRWKGENVSTAEVEAALSRSVIGVRETAVYGVEIPGTDGKAGMASIVDPSESVDLLTLANDLKNQLPSYARPIFIRLLKEIDITGTFKIKKFDLQREGFDVNKIPDPIFYFANGRKYERLNSIVYQDIISGKLRL